MKKTLLFSRLIAIGLIMLFSSGWAVGQVTISSQGFETDLTEYSHAPSQTPATDPGDQYFYRAEPSDAAIYEGSVGPYTNVTGSWLFVGSNPNTINGGSEGLLTLDGIDVTGYTDLEFHGDFGACPLDWDAADDLRIEYNFDGGAWSTLFSFAVDAGSDGTNEPLELSGNAAGGINTADGTVLTYDLVTISSDNFTGSGTTLNIRLACNSGANYEAFGVDNIIIKGVVSATPTLTITSPNGGESWVEGSTHDITWNSSNYTGTVDIEYTTDDVNYTLVVEDTDDDGTYSWGTEYDIAADTYKIRISDDRTSITTSDESDAVFELTRTIHLVGSMNAWTPAAMTLQEDLGTSTWKYTYQENAVTAIEFKYKTDGSSTWTHQWGRGDVVVFSELTDWWNAPGGNGTLTATLTKFYTYIFKDVANGANGEGYVFETTATPVTLDAVSHLPADVTPVNPVVVTITASATPSAGENVYVRYTTDGFTSSSYVLASFTGTAGTATIPAQADGTTVAYYVLSTGLDLTTPPTDVDLATIYYNTNSGANYSYYSETPGVEPILGDLVITEVAGEDADGNGDDDGFVEILNTSSNRLTLDNVSVRYFNLNPSDVVTTVSLSGILDAGEFVVITRNDAAFLAQHGFSADFSGSDFYFNGGDDGVDIYHSSLGTLDQFNDNGASATAWTWTDTSVWERTSDGSGAVQSNWTEYPDETGTPKSLLSLYWTGTLSIDWAISGNWLWGIVPTSSYDVTIFNGATRYPDINVSTAATCNVLEIESEAELTVTGVLTPSGTTGGIIINSDASSSGSLIVKGTLVSVITKSSQVAPSSTITYKRYVTGGKWHLLSAPVDGQAISSLLTNADNNIELSGSDYSMKDYDASADGWNTLFTAATGGNMTAGNGYAVTRATDGTITMDGELADATVAKALSGAGNGWNLLGNPYPSEIRAVTGETEHLLRATNVAEMDPAYAALYIWDEDGAYDGSQNYYKLLNNAGDGTLGSEDYLQAGQGFFVKAIASPGNFTFVKSMQEKGPATFFKDATATWPSIELTAETESAKASTVFTYNSMMTKGLDVSYDAGLLNSYPEFALYSRLVENNEGTDFMLQALPEDYDNLIVPIGLDAKAGEIVTFSAKSLNIPEDYTVVLEDRAMQVFTDLSDEGEYTVQFDNASEGTGRFFVRTSMKSALGIGDIEKGAFQVFTRVQDQQLVIRGEFTANTVARIYSITGKRVATINLEQATEQSVLFNGESGVYIVQISNEQGNYTQKFSWVK